MSITKRLPAALSERLTSASAQLFQRAGREVDVAIGGIPFRLATTADIPQTVETVPIRKDQVDTENDPGEQSLSIWWRRSQASWHGGAGDLYQEASDATVDSTSFYKSSGIDVFGIGKMTLLKRMKLWPLATGTSRVSTFATSTTRTNYCTNPSLETNTTGWTAGGAILPTITRDNTRAHTGSWSAKVSFPVNWDFGNYSKVTVPIAALPANSPFVATARVWLPAGSDTLTMRTGSGARSSTTTAGDWRKLQVSGTADGAGAVDLHFYMLADPAQDVWIDAICVEAGSIAGPYFDGSSPGASWSGTANNSTSTLAGSATGVSVAVVSNGGLYTASSIGGGLTLLHGGSGLVDGVVVGSTFYDITSGGTLFQGAGTSWPLTGGQTPSRLGWGKHRLWVIGGRSLWQPDLALASGTNQPPKFTHPNNGWVYTSMAEASSAMLFAGHDGHTSSIQAITLDPGGGVPTLSGAAVTASLPTGELVQEIACLAGQYVGIGTSRGFRVGTVDENGRITYGPLFIEPENVTACTSLTTQGRFFVVGFATLGGDALAYRVDTATVNDDGTFPYAADISCEFTGNITSMAGISGSQLVCTTQDGRLWYQSTTEYVPSGWLETGRIRYRTMERKSFRSLLMDIAPLKGSVAVDLIREGGSTLALGSLTIQDAIMENRFLILDEPMRYASVKFTLARSDDGLGAPAIHSYQVEALPAVKPARLITLPLLCYDREQALSGQRYGGTGFARDRLAALQLIEDDASVITYQDFSDGNSVGQLVTIESMRFVQTAPPPSSKGSPSGQGGILLLQLRTAET